MFGQRRRTRIVGEFGKHRVHGVVAQRGAQGVEPFAGHVVGRDAGVQRVVYAGSSSVYGDTVERPKRESMSTNPQSPYAVAKLTGESYVRVFSKVYDLEGVVLRYFNIFGPGQNPKSDYAAVIPAFVTA